MGILKNAMEEAIEEGNHFSIWDCPKCEFANEDDFDIPAFDIPSDRARDWKTTNLTEIVCENCEEAFEGTISNRCSLRKSPIPLSTCGLVTLWSHSEGNINTR